VGDSVGVIQKFSEGAFGTGVVARIARGYTYISRKYNVGDNIVIVGFSRGAYTARALAGLISAMGVLRQELADTDKRYDYAFNAWAQYRENKKSNLIQKIIDFMAAIAEKRIFADDIKLSDKDFVNAEDIKIQAIGVWDTVGALGVPTLNLENLGETIDLFQFADKELSDRVKFGFHAISIDEKRPPFTPTFWDKRTNKTIVQRLFAGAHSDVGGGYDEHALSDITLQWMKDKLENSAAVLFKSTDKTNQEAIGQDTEKDGTGQDSEVVVHCPWRKSGWKLLALDNNNRDFSGDFDFELDPSVINIIGKNVQMSPDGEKVPYNPKNISNFLQAKKTKLAKAP
jgi:uncharacterized protein (DUF2235 family)